VEREEREAPWPYGWVEKEQEEMDYVGLGGRQDALSPFTEALIVSPKAKFEDDSFDTCGQSFHPSSRRAGLHATPAQVKIDQIDR